tara:strand:+ start:3010 stop:3669 length:660 start_codon:yes stop_codon:yes gene_type:complete
MKLLSEFDTLELAQAYIETTYKPISAGVSSQFFGIMGMLDALEANVNNTELVTLSSGMPETTIGSLCRTVLNSANTTGFASDPTKEDGILNRAGAQILVDKGIFQQPLVDLFWSKSLVTTKPHENATRAQFNSAKGLHKSIPINYQGGKDITVTLNTDLAEKVAATVWRTEAGFNAENAGRNVHIQTANKYRIDMSGKKSGNYEVRVPLLDADFSIEVI